MTCEVRELRESELLFCTPKGTADSDSRHVADSRDTSIRLMKGRFTMQVLVAMENAQTNPYLRTGRD